MVLTTEHIKEIVASYFATSVVRKAWLFGSYARGEADEDSDVDLLLDIDCSTPACLDYLFWREELGERLRKKVDIVSVGWENKHIKPFIDKDKKVIYEK